MGSLRRSARCACMAFLAGWSVATYAEPWYSGPLLSDPAIVTPLGHGYVEVHAYQVNNNGIYNRNYDFYSIPLAISDEVDTALNYGLTEQTEVQVEMAYLNNKMQGRESSNLGDTTITFATQLMLQKGRKWPPNVKLMFYQTFPTGRYDNLNPNLYGTDATGQGSYLSTFAINMEHVTNLGGENYLVGFATASVILPSRVNLQGFTLYGGGSETHGSIWPGNAISFNLATEYCMQQHWGFIIETFIFAQRASHFTGNLGYIKPRFLTNKGFSHHVNLGRRIIFNRLRPSDLNLDSPQLIGHGNVNQFTLAPAIDYSFTENVSLTGGVWFSVAGKNSPAFYTPMLVFTGNW